jgi:hypothetical protein
MRFSEQIFLQEFRRSGDQRSSLRTRATPDLLSSCSDFVNNEHEMKQ